MIKITKPIKTLLLRNGKHYTTHAWYAYQILLAMKNLHKCVRSYIIAMIKRLPKIEIVKRDKEFEELLGHWRTVGSPQLKVSDEVESFQSMADGKRYTSRARYRNELKARGCEEVGNERKALAAVDNYDEMAYERKLDDDVARAAAELA